MKSGGTSDPDPFDPKDEWRRRVTDARRDAVTSLDTSHERRAEALGCDPKTLTRFLERPSSDTRREYLLAVKTGASPRRLLGLADPPSEPNLIIRGIVEASEAHAARLGRAAPRLVGTDLPALMEGAGRLMAEREVFSHAARCVRASGQLAVALGEARQLQASDERFTVAIRQQMIVVENVQAALISCGDNVSALQSALAPFNERGPLVTHRDLAAPRRGQPWRYETRFDVQGPILGFAWRGRPRHAHKHRRKGPRSGSDFAIYLNMELAVEVIDWEDERFTPSLTRPDIVRAGDIDGYLRARQLAQPDRARVVFSPISLPQGPPPRELSSHGTPENDPEP